MNLWAVGLSFGGCTAVGVWLYLRSWRRVQFYTVLENFCNYLEHEISFALRPLPQVVGDFLPQSRGRCQQVLERYLTLLEQHQDLTRAKCLALTDESMLADFLYNLGRMGVAEERAKIQTAKAQFAAAKLAATQYLQTKASTWLKLLIIIGIAGGILWM